MDMTDLERAQLASHWKSYTSYQKPIAAPMDPHGMPVHGPMPWHGHRVVRAVQYQTEDGERWAMVSEGYTDHAQAEHAARVHRSRTGDEVRVVVLQVQTTYTIEAVEVGADAEADARALEDAEELDALGGE